MASPADDHLRWREERLARLTADDGWLTVVGLVWLEEGANGVGSDGANAAVLPGGPARLGDVVIAAGRAEWRPDRGEPVPLKSDADGTPTAIRHGDLEFFVILRNGQPALRIRDRNAPARRAFAGIAAFPFDPAWRIDAAWDGECARFEHAGCHHSLRPQEPAAQPLHFVFGDATNGRDTYGGGRFLQADPPRAGRVLLDFNRAINPPCVFTPYATCPLPAPENRLPFAVSAGEKLPAAHP